MRKTVILINGKAQSGKSTLAELLASKIQNSKVIHNADSVKELATNFFGWNGVKDDDGRELLIGISEVGYDYKDNFWEYKTLSKIENKDEVIIIPDFRYEQTYHFFKEQGFRVIALYVSMTKDINTMNEIMKEHLTEQRLNIKFDMEFINKFGNEKLLEEFTDEFIKYYKLKKVQTFKEELECTAFIYEYNFLDELKEKGFIELIWKRENEEKREIDWTKVPKWTKVLVRNDKDDEWKKAYFLGTSPLGFDTTFSDKFTLNDDHIRIWQYIKLYDENDMKEEWCK